MARDLVHAWRGLSKRPAFFVASLLTLTIGIGANLTIFSFINGLTLRPMPFGERSDRLFTLHPANRLIEREPGWGHSEISFADLQDFRTATAVEGIGAYLSRSFVLSADAAGAERVRGGSVTPDLFPLLGVEPFLGRHFRADEAAPPGRESVVMLTHALWQRRYGADDAIVGKEILVNERPLVVVGVLPRGVRFPERDEIYAPLRFDDQSRSDRNVNAVALLKPGATETAARIELETIAKRLEAAYPETNRGFGVRVFPIRRSYTPRDGARTQLMLMGAVAFVLLIMCANLANLMLVRGAGRQRELTVRAAMGASHQRLMWISLSESLLIVLPGALLGLLASQWAIDAITGSMANSLPYWAEFGIDVRVGLFTIALALFTVLAVGLYPSLRAATPNLVDGLRDSGRGVSLGPAGQRMQSALVVVQIALCLGLLVGADLMVRSLVAMRTTSLGFNHERLVSAGGFLAGAAFNDVGSRAAFFRNVAGTLASTPGVAAAAVVSAIPGDDGGSARRLVIDGHTGEGDEVGVDAISIGPTLFDALGVPLIEGRTFTEQEAADPDANVAIINQRLASRLWPNPGVVDRRIGFRSGEAIRWLRVVGVAPDVHYQEVGNETEQSRLTVYIPYAMDGSRAMGILVRAEGAPESLVAPVRAVLQRSNATFAVGRLMPMRELLRLTTWQEQLYSSLMATFAFIALLLACLGIYALIAYSVGRRSREIGVRLALGARPADVVMMLLRETVRVGGMGLLAGLTLALLIARALSRSLYGVRVDASLFASMVLPLAAAIFLATWLPARRAARVEPTIALRDE